VQALERDAAIARQVDDFMHGRHAAASDRPFDPVPPGDDGVRGQVRGPPRLLWAKIHIFMVTVGPGAFKAT
jgi:hypothetical protein